MYFFFVFNFLSGTFIGLQTQWHSKLSHCTQDKQIFHLKIMFLTKHRRTFPSESSIITVHIGRRDPRERGVVQKILRAFCVGGPLHSKLLRLSKALDGSEFS